MAGVSERGLEALDEGCLHLMIQAYDDAWRMLQGSIFAAQPRAKKSRQILERRIIELVRNGERDAVKLRDEAVAYFNLAV
jgi:hypothetical protein